MRRRLVLIAVGFTAAWLAVLCAAAQAVMLRYAPKVGTKVSYDHAVTSTSDATVAGQTMHVDSTMHMTATYTAKAQTPKGTRVEVAMRDGSMTLTMPGAETPRTQKIPDMTTTMLIDDRGQMQQAKTSGEDQQASAMSDDLLSNLSGFSMFPKTEVKPGDTWSDTLETKAMGKAGAAVKVAFTCTLLELSTYQGRQCAKIRTTFKGTTTATGMPGTGNLQGSALQYYDYENSLWVDGEVKMTMNMKLPGQGDSEGGSMLMHMAMTMKMKK